MKTGYKLITGRMDAGRLPESDGAAREDAGFSKGGKKMQVRTGLRVNQVVSLGLLASSLVAFVPQAPGEQYLAGQRVFRVRLTAPVSSDSTPGSKVVAQVVSPEEFAGNIMEGEVVKAKSSGRVDEKSVLMFSFSKLYHGTSTIDVEGKIMRSYNSKGQENVDEQGYLLNNDRGFLEKLPKSLPGCFPARIPGVRNRKVQTAVQLAALMIAYTAKAPKISFDTGSEFEIQLVQR